MSKNHGPVDTIAEVWRATIHRPARLKLSGKGVDHPVASVIDTVVNLAKRRGFVFPSSEIYGGTRSAWDYGPLGVELKENIRRAWWHAMVISRDDIVGLDSAGILSTDACPASAHLAPFHAPPPQCPPSPPP